MLQNKSNLWNYFNQSKSGTRKDHYGQIKRSKYKGKSSKGKYGVQDNESSAFSIDLVDKVEDKGKHKEESTMNAIQNQKKNSKYKGMKARK